VIARSGTADHAGRPRILQAGKAYAPHIGGIEPIIRGVAAGRHARDDRVSDAPVIHEVVNTRDRHRLPMREDALTRPVSPYGVSKLAGEQLCYLYHVNYGLPTVSLRYFTVYGPRQRPDMGFHKFLSAAVRDEPVTIYGDGEQTRDFTFVDDVVHANIAAAAQGVPGRVYNIGGGSRVSINEVLDMIGRVSCRRLRVTVDSDQKGDMRHTYADTSRARADLGFVPSVGLEDGLAAQFRWLSSSSLLR